MTPQPIRCDRCGQIMPYPIQGCVSCPGLPSRDPFDPRPTPDPTQTPAQASSPSVREVLEMLARAIETERDRQKCGVFFSDLVATLDPSHLRILATPPRQPALSSSPSDLELLAANLEAWPRAYRMGGHDTMVCRRAAEHLRALVQPAQAQADLHAVYLERARLVAALSTQFPASLERDPADPAWPVCIIQLPTGQASWHIAPADLHLFAHLPWGQRTWDGHTTELKYERLEALATPAPQAQAEAGAEEKAALWDALLGCARIRPLGWAGMKSDGSAEEKDPYGNPNNGYAHLGLELWTIYPGVTPEDSEKGRVLLEGFTRIAAQAPADAQAQGGEGSGQVDR